MEIIEIMEIGTIAQAVPVIGLLIAVWQMERKRANSERERNDDLERIQRATLREFAGMQSEESRNGAK